METGFALLLLLTAMVVGVAVGILIGKMQAERRYEQDTQYTQGTLNAYCSDPESDPGFYLGLGVSAKEITSRKYVVFDVKLLKQNSHE